MAATNQDRTSMIRARIDAALSVLVAKGWQVTKNNPEAEPLLPERYKALPPEFVEFERLVARCVAPWQQTWILGSLDYQPVSAGSFRWNEYEMMTLDAVVGDAAEIRKCKLFWNTHIPVCMEVSGDYAFVAIVAQPGPECGRVVVGWGPMFEDDASRFSIGFLDFLEIIGAESGARACVLVDVLSRLEDAVR